jgi:hypothetical protein
LYPPGANGERSERARRRDSGVHVMGWPTAKHKFSERRM